MVIFAINVRMTAKITIHYARIVLKIVNNAIEFCVNIIKKDAINVKKFCF